MTDIPINDIPTYNRKDFVSDQTVRWCPGCGDYAILAAVQKAMPQIGKRKEDIVFVSGIGCSSRFPYYMDTYGMHTIHGRAPTIATGLKITNPDLSVWIVTGDGDGLSIGGNHLIHVCRRNVDVNILLFNNRIYGLTKGQYSPTSQVGAKTKSSPMGSIDRDFNPLAVALAAESSFVARAVDTNTKHLEATMLEAAEHQGTSFIEILQNCVIFNDGTWNHVTDRKQKDDNSLFLTHGEQMTFGKEGEKAIIMHNRRLKVVNTADVDESEILVHDKHNPVIAYQIARMEFPEFPVAFGVLFSAEAPVYEREVIHQVETLTEQKGAGDLHSLFHNDYTWVVEENAVEVGNIPEELEVRGSVTGDDLEEEYMDDLQHALTGNGNGAINKTVVHYGLEEDMISELLQDHPTGIITVKADDSLQHTIDLMLEKNIGAMVVVDAAGHPVGIFTEFDVLTRVATRIENFDQHTVGEFMTKNPDVLPEQVPIAHALHLMSIHHYRHVPIVDEDNVVRGIISFRDVVNYIERYFDTDDE